MKLPGNNKRLTDRLLEGVCLCLLFAALMVPLNSEARPADYIDVGNIRNFNLGTWTGAGGLSRTRTTCIASANDNSRRPGRTARVMPYQVKVDSNDLPASDFYIYLDGNSSHTGSKRIRVMIQHRDRYMGNSYEQLSYGNYDSHGHDGDFNRCPTNGNNSQVRVEISASEMSGKFSGRYRGNFSLTGIGGSSGNAIDSDNFRIDVTIQAGPEVQISRLDNINMGSHSGLGNINAEENFCVHSTSASGSYTLSVSSSNQDGAGNFNLDGAGGIGQIAYRLYFIDQANGPGSVEITNNSVSGFGNSTDQFCNGQNNATLSVTVSEQDLQQAKTGSYKDTLTILVAPQ